ncbi:MULTISPECIES: hypothetical protein [unclassified Acinetobacter]|uniref:hypothetical protein n=1 Tax=unclassified Acinetobacter TaxID=196816 RepID=UPI001D0DF5B0|nr:MULTISPECIES: hypothetical protein [unclassified Acinetobacter]
MRVFVSIHKLGYAIPLNGMKDVLEGILGLYQLQRRQTWFVLLMVFIMSWSGVAVASVKNMHAGMMQNAVHTMQHASNISPCHSRNMQHATVQNDLKKTNESMVHCHQKTSLHSSAILQSCQDCHQLHCQNLNSYVEHVSPALPQPVVFAANIASHPDYKVQHLAGFWHEILRPPKV